MEIDPYAGSEVRAEWFVNDVLLTILGDALEGVLWESKSRWHRERGVGPIGLMTAFITGEEKVLLRPIMIGPGEKAKSLNGSRALKFRRDKIAKEFLPARSSRECAPQ